MSKFVFMPSKIYRCKEPLFELIISGRHEILHSLFFKTIVAITVVLGATGSQV